MRGAGSARDRLRPYVDRARRFSGWRFNDVVSTVLGSPVPWSYSSLAAELLTTAVRVLDMGTGGGEIFEELLPAYRGRAVATEEWHVNAPLAAGRLGPHGVDVVRCRSVVLPFRDGVFNVVLNRHEELDPGEIARILSPGGRVLTQQVGRDHWKELRDFFPRMQDEEDLFHRYQDDLKSAGLTIVEAKTHDTKVAYRGLGEIVFMLCVTPWTIPEFDPLDRDLQALLDLERALSTEDGLVLANSLFLIEARKPA